MSTRTQDRVIQVISSIMNIPTKNLNELSSPESISQWESMKHINLVLALEEEFGMQFDDEQITKLQSVKTIVQIIDNVA
jgi:acyl carrier protein